MSFSVSGIPRADSKPFLDIPKSIPGSVDASTCCEKCNMSSFLLSVVPDNSATDMTKKQKDETKKMHKTFKQIKKNNNRTADMQQHQALSFTGFGNPG